MLRGIAIKQVLCGTLNASMWIWALTWIEYHARTQQGPYFLEFETYRWREHCGPNFDNDLGYRSENEYQEWKQRCPVESFEKSLLDAKILKKNQVDEMRRTILQEFEEAVDFAKSSPFPDPGEIGKNLYKEKDLNPV